MMKLCTGCGRVRGPVQPYKCAITIEYTCLRCQPPQEAVVIEDRRFQNRIRFGINPSIFQALPRKSA